MAENIHCSLKTGGRRLLFCLLLCALLISGAAGAARAETYGENAFGFVDAVMDSRDGIPEDAEGRLARIREVGVLRVATEPYFAPQYTLSLGYHFSEDTESSGLLIRTEDREEIRSLEDLAGRDLAAQRGTLQESLLAEGVTDYRQFRRLVSVREVYLALQQGKADAAMVDRETARSYLESNPDCGLMLVENLGFGMAEECRGDRIAARKGENQLIAFVNDIIRDVVESGEYERWYRQHALNADWLGI